MALAESKQQMASLIKETSPCVHTLKKTYRFYHYTTIEKIQDTLPNGLSVDYAIANHARLWSDYFWNANRNGRGGFYTAIDPVISEANGLSPKGGTYLYRVEMPRGTNYLLPDNFECSFSAVSEAFLKSVKCPISIEGIFRGYKLEPTCVPVVRNLAQKFQLRGYAYGYGSSSFTGCSERPSLAFVWFDLKGIPDDKIAVFSKSAPQLGSSQFEEALEIEKLLEEKSQSLWPSLYETKREGEPLKKFKGDYLMGCENIRNPVQ
jgi:hypothetical protein